MKIYLIHFINILKKIITYYPRLNLQINIAVVFESYKLIVYYIRELKDYKTYYSENYNKKYIMIIN
jgi:hypothetical protein